MTTITSSIQPYLNGYKAVVLIKHNNYTKRVVSDEYFTNQEIAIKHANAWRNELRTKYI